MASFSTILNTYEYKLYNAFIEGHWMTENENVAPHEGCVQVFFTETGIGTKVVIRCTGCKQEKDITDYDSW